MTGWHLDDPAWVRERREKWAAVQADLELSQSLTARNRARLKEHFLKGSIDASYDFKQPKPCASLPLVFRVWLHPDRDQQTFDALYAQADVDSLRYTDHYLGSIAVNPPRTIDDVIARFYELFYLHPERAHKAVNPRTGAQSSMKPQLWFPPSGLIVWLMGWMIGNQRTLNPIVRYLISDLERLTEAEWDSQVALDADNDRGPRFIESLRKILSNPGEPRFETAQRFMYMLRAGKLPRNLTTWMKDQGFDV